MIDIACVTDENYIPHLAALLSSVQNNSSVKINAHILHDEVPADLRTKIDDMCHRISISWHAISQHPVLDLPPLLQISRATYLRLIMDEILDDSINRILYLDVDMVVTSDLLPLWNTDLGDYVCGAVFDPGVDSASFAMQYKLNGKFDYFNAGVILFDMTKIRRFRIFAKALASLQTQEFQFADQDALNMACWGRWRPLDAKWNFQREYLYDDFSAWWAHSDGVKLIPNIIHFTEATKPWQSGEWHPLAWIYWKNLARTPFAIFVFRREGIKYFSLIKHYLKYRGFIKRSSLRRRSVEHQ